MQRNMEMILEDRKLVYRIKWRQAEGNERQVE